MSFSPFADLTASRQFYEEVIGLILTAEEDDAFNFRGVEEACHHSLVLQGAGTPPARGWAYACSWTPKAFFEAHGCPANWVEVPPHQGHTLHATDAFGTPLEFCASMPVMPRMITRFTHATPTALRCALTITRS
jgi:catechol 2,3-dioxygenase